MVLGVVGLGRVGGTVARIGLAFGMKIIAWSQNMTPEIAAAAGATMVPKSELFRQADIVTIHLVLSKLSPGPRASRTTWMAGTSPAVTENGMEINDCLVASLLTFTTRGRRYLLT
jgi:hypothetical protein